MSAYDKARDLVDEFACAEGLMANDYDPDGESYSEPYLTDAGQDWLIAKIEKALREAGLK